MIYYLEPCNFPCAFTIDTVQASYSIGFSIGNVPSGYEGKEIIAEYSAQGVSFFFYEAWRNWDESIDTVSDERFLVGPYHIT